MRIIAVLLLFIFLIPSGADAQLFPGTNPLTLTLTPRSPRPYETVAVKVGSTVIDLAASRVTVYQDGTVIEEGSGALTAEARMGGPGSRTVIRAVAEVNGASYEATATISPSDVALIVEPASSVHPFYAGAALVAPEARVRVIALADFRDGVGNRIPAESLSYSWKVGEKALQAESGLGRSVLSASAPKQYRDAVVSVTVSTADKSRTAEQTVSIVPASPLVRIYRNDPLLGILYDAALSRDETLDGTEETFRAVPYYFGSAPALSWTVNGAASGTDEDVTVRVTGSGAGSANLAISAKEADAFQAASESVTLRFGTPRTGIFGF